MVCLRLCFFLSFFFAARGISKRGKTGLGPTDKTGKLHVDRYIRGRWSSLLERKLRLLLHLLSPPPFPTHIQFPYILSAAYHVIAETYAHKCADMCTGPGSTGRVRDTWCTAKNTINSSSPFLFSLFFFCFHLSSAAPCLSFSTRCTTFLPSTPI